MHGISATEREPAVDECAVEVTVQTISRGEIRVSGLSPMDGSLLDRYAEAPMACGRV